MSLAALRRVKKMTILLSPRPSRSKNRESLPFDLVLKQGKSSSLCHAKAGPHLADLQPVQPAPAGAAFAIEFHELG